MKSELKLGILIYQTVFALIGTLLLFISLFSLEFIPVCIIGIGFNIVVLVSCYIFYKKNEYNLFLVCQYVQVLGIAAFGVSFYLHPCLFFGPYIHISKEINIGITATLPQYSFLMDNRLKDIMLTINLSPVIIIYMLEKHFKTQKNS